MHATRMNRSIRTYGSSVHYPLFSSHPNLSYKVTLDDAQMARETCRNIYDRRQCSDCYTGFGVHERNVGLYLDAVMDLEDAFLTDRKQIKISDRFDAIKKKLMQDFKDRVLVQKPKLP